VTSDPWAEHRLVADARIHPVTIFGHAGDKVEIRLSTGSRDALVPIAIAGSVTAGVGLVLASIAFTNGLGYIGDTAVTQAEHDARARNATLFQVGFGTMLAGGALLVVGLLVGRTKLDVTREQGLDGALARRALFTF
jgi:hypothetical protein